jgi:hypothetical protein
MPIPIHIEGKRVYDEVTNKFITIKTMDLVLEHSLLSISKWESKWHKPFLNERIKKTPDEITDYIRCMVVSPKEFDPHFVNVLTRKQSNDIQAYISDSMSATTFTIRKKSVNREVITSELIYYWMFGNQIPKECEKWHLNRLMNLIQIFGIKNDPKGSKMKVNDIANENDRINEMRRKQLGTKG